MTKKGFTLAELLIVVVILGVLGSIAMPKFYPHKEKAVVAEAVAMLSAIRQGQLGHRLENGSFYSGSDWTQIGIDNPGNSRFSYAITDSATTATATRLIAGASGNCTKTGASGYHNCTIVINLDTGGWTGTHPHIPKNAT